MQKDQMKDIVEGHKAVTTTFQKALDLGDYVNDRFEVSHKRGDIDKRPLPISVPKGAEISDIIEDLVVAGDFEIPFLGKKGKGMVVSMIRKNKAAINEKAQVLLENAMEQAQNPDELSKQAKEELR